MALDELSSQLESALRTKSDVNQHDVGVQLVDLLHGLRNRRRGANDLQPVALQAGPRDGQEPLVVVDDYTALHHSISMPTLPMP